MYQIIRNPNTIALKRKITSIAPDFIRGPPPESVSFGKYPPNCNHCKHFIPFKKYLDSDQKDVYGAGYGLCKMFGNESEVIKYSFAKHCRENEYQCGLEGYLYEEMDPIDHLNRLMNDIKNDFEDNIGATK